MANHPKGAILQRDKQTYAIVPRTPVGMLTPDDLESLARVARKYQIPVIKITSGQRFALVGMKKEDVDRIWEDLGMDIYHWWKFRKASPYWRYFEGRSVKNRLSLPAAFWWLPVVWLVR